MVRRVILGIVVAASTCAAFVPAASASPISLYMSQGAAFSILGHSCGGIQEKVYATGFGSNGYPTGDVYLSTRCGGSGRGGGYKTTTYTAWASTAWTWFGETRSAAPISSGEENTAFSATDAHGDHIYNVGSSAYLETGEPPLQAPATPTGINVFVGLAESGETEFLRMSVTWTPDPETAGLLSGSTVTATPVGGGTVLTATTSGSWSTAYLSPVAPNTTYLVTVTNTDAEGTSNPNTPIEVKSPNSDGEAPKETKNTESCTSNHGTITLKPGISETPSAQTITVKGELSGCSGPRGFESGKYVAHMTTTEEVACSVLQSTSLEPITAPVSLSVKWAPAEEGTSKGTLVLPLSEVSLTGLTGSARRTAPSQRPKPSKRHPCRELQRRLNLWPGDRQESGEGRQEGRIHHERSRIRLAGRPWPAAPCRRPTPACEHSPSARYRTRTRAARGTAAWRALITRHDP